MPNVAGLTILLGADFTSAEQAMDAFNGKVSQFVQQMQTLFASAGVNVQNFQKTLVSLTATQEQLTSALRAGNDEIKKLGDTTIKINDYTKRLTSDVGTLGYTLTRTIHGFADLFVRPGQAILILSNDIPQLITRFRELTLAQQEIAASGGVAKSATQLLSEAFDPLILVTQLGLTALIRFAPQLYNWATGADKAAASAKALADRQKELREIELSSEKTAGEQIGTIETLSATMTNNKLSMQQRTNAYNEALKLYPSYLDGVSKDAALNGALSDIINQKLIPSILAAAQARAYEEKINKLTADNIDLQEQQAQAVINTGKAYLAYQKAKENAAKPMSAYGNAGTGSSAAQGYIAIANEAYNNYKKAIEQQDAITHQIGVNSDAMKDYAKNIQNVAQGLGHLDISGKDIGTLKYGTSSKSKKTAQDQLNDIIKSMQESIDNANLDLSDKLINPVEANRRITEAINSAISKVQQLKIADKDTIIAKLMGEYPNQLVDLNSIRGNISRTPFGDAQKLAEGQKTAMESVFNSMDTSFNKSTSENSKEAKKELSDLNKQFTDTVQNWDSIIGQPIKTFYNDLLEGKNVFKDIQKSFEELIANMVAKATEAAIISLILGKKYSGQMGGQSTFQSVFKQLLGGRWGNTENPIKSLTDNSGTNKADSIVGSSLGILNAISSNNQNNPALDSFQKSKSIGDAAMKQIQGMTADKTQSSFDTALGTIGSVASFIPGVGTAVGLGLNLLKGLHLFADGGIVTGPTLAMIGEAGKEAVLPLDKLNQFTNNAQSLDVNVRGVATGRDLSIVGTNYQTYKDR